MRCRRSCSAYNHAVLMIKTMKQNSAERPVRIEIIAMLGALALFLSTVEYMIPKPVPFMRIGLANLAVMLGLLILDGKEYAVLVLIKVMGQGLIHGTLFSYIFLFSAAGSSASGLLMFLLFRMAGSHVSFIGISILGGLSSNIAQIVLARFLLFGESAWLIAPPFLAVGFLSSVFLGFFVEKFHQQSNWIARMRSMDLRSSSAETGAARSEHLSAELINSGGGGSSVQSWKSRRNLPLLFGLLMLPAVVFTDSPAVLVGQTVFLLLLHVIQGRRLRPLPVVIMLISITLLNLFQVNGRVLLTIFTLPVTEGALNIGLRKAFVLIELIYLSQYMISQKPYFPGRLGTLLSRQFHYFSEFMQNAPSLHPRHFIHDVDALIIQLAGEADAAENRSGKQNSGSGKQNSGSGMNHGTEGSTEKRSAGNRSYERPASGFFAAAVPAAAFWILTIGLRYALPLLPF